MRLCVELMIQVLSLLLLSHQEVVELSGGYGNKENWTVLIILSVHGRISVELLIPCLMIRRQLQPQLNIEEYILELDVTQHMSYLILLLKKS